MRVTIFPWFYSFNLESNFVTVQESFLKIEYKLIKTHLDIVGNKKMLLWKV